MRIHNNKDIGMFIKGITDEVQFKEAHEEIRKEYLSHIEEAVEAGLSYGLNEEAAVHTALVRMGDSKKIGSNLDEIHKPGIDLTMLISTVSLCLLGIFSLRAFNLALLQSLWFFGGVLICGAMIFVKPSTVFKLAPFAYPTAILLLFIGYLGGVFHEGQPYISFLGINIKIVDLSAILFFLGVVGIYHSLARQKKSPDVLMSTLSILPMVFYSVIQSFFPAVLFFVGVIAVLISTKFKTKYLCSVTCAGILSLGVGIEDGFVNFEHLPSAQQSEAHTDFIFNQMMTGAPYLGAIVAVLFGLLLVRIVTVSRELRNPFTKSLSTGSAAILICATVWGVLSNIGYAPMPIAGLNIPFLSYGGSLLVANLALIGIILGANRRKMLSSL